ncbi:IucA/IucC family protein [Polymorphospora sp. NPDC050346]|uniref:IucA/IucC family protein n=1 Tax=Polymorphospora sp. NPDC050346 TaxID=3155780 RepID=UPI0033FCB508
MTAIPTIHRRRLCACATGVGTVAGAAAHTADELRIHAPDLVDGFRAALPAAASTVGRRLAGALVREDIGDARVRWAGAGTRHGFDRVEFDTVDADEPVDLLPGQVMDRRGWALATELTNAVVNLAIAYARRATRPVPAGSGADGSAVDAERLAVDGHNLHPCGRTRLGWSVAEVLAHDLEAGATRVGFVAVRRDLLTGDDIGAELAAGHPDVPAAPPGYVSQPVHAWQLESVLPHRYADLWRDGALRPLDGELTAAPTAALRTLLLPAGRDGRRRYLKLSLDIQVTSTRRTISVASTRNGPAISALLHRLLADDPAGGRVLLLAETAGAALPAGAGRDASAILRSGLDDRLGEGEVAVPGGALPARDGAGTVLAALVDRYAVTRGRPDRAGAALGFLTEYARLLLTPVLRLATRYGIGLEAHLQNCLPTFVDGVPHRIVFRDFAGLRLHRPRLAAAGRSVPLWPGSVVGTDDVAVLRAKVGYTALQAHLGELVVRLAGSHGLAEPAAWRAVRAVVDEVYEPLRADPATAAAAAADHAALTADRVPHKALVRMRLAGDGDIYIPVRNPLHAA